MLTWNRHLGENKMPSSPPAKTEKTLVMKFGGTSVGSMEGLKQVIAIVSAASRNWQHVIVIASAFSGVTTNLLASATSAAQGNLQPYENTLTELRHRHMLMLNAFSADASANEHWRKILQQLIDQFSQLILAIAAIGESSPHTLDAVASLGERLSVCILTARFAHLASAKNFLAAMDKAAHAMIANPGTKTNAEVFDEVFFSMVGFEKSDSLQIFEDFYQTDFPKLYKETEADPEAPLLVHKAKAKGIICVLATNPLFPHAATRQRLNWAGLQMEDFSLVTTYENSRAAKPNLKYYRDILSFINQPAESCLMVGDQAWDMVAGELGMQTYLVRSPNTDMTTTMPTPTAEGTLADLYALL
ncbi:MAG: HAD family hydrolase [Anaerolineaceae bacterium]|nr:HAD family hydrolase [Anaerolineaceae bacterium]